MKKLSIAAAPLLLMSVMLLLSWLPAARKEKREFFQLRVYHFNDTAQEHVLDDYLREAFVPALHRSGFDKVGVFKPIANDTSASKLLYVLITSSSLEKLSLLPDRLRNDAAYAAASAAYHDANYTRAPYSRLEIILLRAFPLAPTAKVPALASPKSERVYELRSYESATEAIFRNKIEMFNEGGETVIFQRLGFNAAFYGEVLSGSHMPNLMYMTCFNNMAEREQHWKAFGEDTAWKRLSALPRYQHNVSHIDISFLRPTGYSDF